MASRVWRAGVVARCARALCQGVRTSARGYSSASAVAANMHGPNNSVGAATRPATARRAFEVPRARTRATQLQHRRWKTTVPMVEDFPVPRHLPAGRANPWKEPREPNDEEWSTSFTHRRLKRNLIKMMEVGLPTPHDLSEPKKMYAHMRDRSGKYIARHLRGWGYVPGAIQSSIAGVPDINIYLNSSQVCRHIRRAKYSYQCQLYELHIEGHAKPILVLPRQYHRNNVTMELENVSFVRYIPGHRYRLVLPLKVIGEEENDAFKRGGFLLRTKRLIDCYWRQPTPKICTPTHLVYDVSKMKGGDVIHLHQLELPTGLTPCNPDINYALMSLKGLGGRRGR